MEKNNCKNVMEMTPDEIRAEIYVLIGVIDRFSFDGIFWRVNCVIDGCYMKIYGNTLGEALDKALSKMGAIRFDEFQLCIDAVNQLNKRDSDCMIPWYFEYVRGIVFITQVMPPLFLMRGHDPLSLARLALLALRELAVHHD